MPSVDPDSVVPRRSDRRVFDPCPRRAGPGRYGDSVSPTDLSPASPAKQHDTAERRRSALAECDLFADLSESALGLLADSARIRRYAPGEAVVRTGEESTALYLIASGEAAVEQHGRDIATLRAGDFFGETAFLSSGPRTADVRAIGGPIEVVEIDAACLRPLLEDHVELADQLAEKMATRQLEGQQLRDETGALISPKGLVTQFRRHLLKIIGR